MYIFLWLDSPSASRRPRYWGIGITHRHTTKASSHPRRLCS